MNLTWHIVRKDLRRMWLPAALWCAFIAGVAAWGSRPILPVGSPLQETFAAGTAVSSFLTVALVLEIASGVLLAASLVLDDPVVGSTAFWLSRPIQSWRLGLANMFGVLLLLDLAPTLALTPVWLANGFAGGELARAIGQTLVLQALLGLIAVGFATVSRDLGGFVLVLLAFVVAFFFCCARVIWNDWIERLPSGPRETGALLAPFVIVVGVGVAAAIQFLRRDARLAWCIIALALPATTLVRAFGPLDLSALWPTREVPVLPPGSVKVRSWKATTEQVVYAEIEAPAGTDVIPAPRSAKLETTFHDRAAIAHLGTDAGWAVDAADRVLNGKRSESPLHWRLKGGLEPATAASPESAGGASVDWVRFMPAEILPLQPGATWQAGAERLRVVSTEPFEAGRFTCVLEVHGSTRHRNPLAEVGFGRLRSGAEEVFVLRKRANGQCAPVETATITRSESRQMAVRLLSVTIRFSDLPVGNAAELATNWELVRLGLRVAGSSAVAVSDLPPLGEEGAR
jgi:hypothetical protein